MHCWKHLKQIDKGCGWEGGVRGGGGLGGGKATILPSQVPACRFLEARVMPEKVKAV